MNYGPASSQLHSTLGEQAISAEAEKKNVNEFVTGKVTDNDHKKDGTPLGWVKVQYPHISGTDSTHWAPCVVHGAGKNRGWFFIPEIGDEVLVGFEHGSFQSPIVLASLWNGPDKPAVENKGGNHKRTIKSRGKQPGNEASSKEGGSIFEIDDNESTITIADGGDGSKKYATIILDGKNNKIIIKSLQDDADVAFQAPKGDLKIVAKKVVIEAQQKYQQKSGQDLKMSTNAAAKIEASGNTKWSGSNHKDNCGGASNVTAPTSTPVDVADPYST